jgi:hypothetical protein
VDPQYRNRILKWLVEFKENDGTSFGFSILLLFWDMRRISVLQLGLLSDTVKGKGKITPGHTMKTYMRSRNITPLIPNLDIR